MIAPSVGRIVWFYPNDCDPIPCQGQPLAAVVCFVHDDRLVNLSVSDFVGGRVGRINVPLVQGNDEPRPAKGGYCTWMTYQIDQAKRAAAVA